jgi:SAM-dependent methyltransferase
VLNFLHTRSGNTCPVCGKETRFSGFTDNVRESGRCSSCKSFNRQRQMAYAIRKVVGLPMHGKFRFEPGFSIYNVESNGALHRTLSAHPGYVCSEYFGPQYVSGRRVRGVRHEDLQRLSFADRFFDLVLSSDVLEHVPEPYLAHREIRRVLKPGGRHIFTVPYDPRADRDDVRARMVNGEIEYLAERLYHGDPVRPKEGVLVWTIFGREMLEHLKDAGFEMQVMTINEPQLGILGDGVVFEATKPAA